MNSEDLIIDKDCRKGSALLFGVPARRPAGLSESLLERSAACPRERLKCPPSVLRRIDKEADDGLFAKRLGSLQPVQTLNEYEARPVSPY